MKINLNDCIKVKLTDYGQQIYYNMWVEINKSIGKNVIEPYYKKVDDNGYSEFQLWDFMNIYGKFTFAGQNNVIDPIEIYFEDET